MEETKTTNSKSWWEAMIKRWAQYFDWFPMGGMMRGIGREGMTGFNCPCFRSEGAFKASQSPGNRETNRCC